MAIRTTAVVLFLVSSIFMLSLWHTDPMPQPVAEEERPFGGCKLAPIQGKYLTCDPE